MIEINYKQINNIIFCIKSTIEHNDKIFNNNYKYFKDNKKIINTHKKRQKELHIILEKLEPLTGLPTDYIIKKQL